MDTLKEPKFETPKGYNNNREYIVQQLKKGMNDKLEAGQIKEEDISEYTTALKKELDLVDDKGYIDYFLITQDFCKFAYDNDILMSPGRGSASGALLCWLLGITHLNPIKYNLFFLKGVLVYGITGGTENNQSSSSQLFCFFNI